MTQLIALTLPGDINGTPATIQVQLPGSVPSCPPTGCLNNLLQPILTLLIVFALLLSLLMFLWAGLFWITSQGDKAKIQKARMRIIYGIIGLLLVFFSYLIINVFGQVLGINLLHPTL